MSKTLLYERQTDREREVDCAPISGEGGGGNISNAGRIFVAEERRDSVSGALSARLPAHLSEGKVRLRLTSVADSERAHTHEPSGAATHNDRLPGVVLE